MAVIISKATAELIQQRHDQQLALKIADKSYLPEPGVYIGVVPSDGYFHVPLDCEFVTFDVDGHIDVYGEMSQELVVNFISAHATCNESYFHVRTDIDFDAAAFARNVTAVGGGVFVVPPDVLNEGWEEKYALRLIELVKSFDEMDSASSIIPYDQFVEVLMCEALGHVSETVSNDQMMTEFFTERFGASGMRTVKGFLEKHALTALGEDIHDFTHNVAATVRSQIETNVEATKTKLVANGDKIVARKDTAIWLSKEIDIEQYFYIFICYEMTYLFWDMFRAFREGTSEKSKEVLGAEIPPVLSKYIVDNNIEPVMSALLAFDVSDDESERFCNHIKYCRSILIEAFSNKGYNFDTWTKRDTLISSFNDEFTKGISNATTLRATAKNIVKKNNIIAVSSS